MRVLDRHLTFKDERVLIESRSLPLFCKVGLSGDMRHADVAVARVARCAAEELVDLDLPWNLHNRIWGFDEQRHAAFVAGTWYVHV